MNFRPTLAIAAMCVVALGCQAVYGQANRSSEEQVKVQQTIVDWLECEECVDGELEAVVKLGEALVPSLANTLQRGPAPERLESVRRRLSDNYDALTAYAKTHPETRIPMTKDEYVRTYLDNYVALYRVRSAQALSRIGGAEARRALEQARDAGYREDVSGAVTESLRQLRGR